jgi:hydroxymethylpyrimidine/phosphomethylpyrimidine kinase
MKPIDMIEYINKYVTITKEEAMAFSSCFKKIKLKLKNNMDYAIYSEYKRIHMLNQDKHYWLDINKVDTSDSTGAGDILASAFTCAFVKEFDPLWAFSFGVGAIMASLKRLESFCAKASTSLRCLSFDTFRSTSESPSRRRISRVQRPSSQRFTCWSA